jgi:hypothetical protein
MGAGLEELVYCRAGGIYCWPCVGLVPGAAGLQLAHHHSRLPVGASPRRRAWRALWHSWPAPPEGGPVTL